LVTTILPVFCVSRFCPRAGANALLSNLPPMSATPSARSGRGKSWGLRPTTEPRSRLCLRRDACQAVRGGPLGLPPWALYGGRGVRGRSVAGPRRVPGGRHSVPQYLRRRRAPESENQVSLRTVRLHPELLKKGFLDWVVVKRKAGETGLFPAAKATVGNGQGNWITKGLSRHLAEMGKGWEPAKRGFHSLRNSFVQQLQEAGIASELRVQIVGHELDNEHHSTYSRDFTAVEKLCGPVAHSQSLTSHVWDSQ